MTIAHTLITSFVYIDSALVLYFSPMPGVIFRF